jgi:hypothetical protein
MSRVEAILAQQANLALGELANPAVASNSELVFSVIFSEFGPLAQSLERIANNAEAKAEMKGIREKLSAKVAQLDQQVRNGRTDLAHLLARGRLAPELKAEYGVLAEGLGLVRTPESVRRKVVASMDRTADGWILTPSIVVSNSNAVSFAGVGGHNIGGRATRVEIDATVPKGRARVTGTYENGRVIRINPTDEGAETDIVRAFDRRGRAQRRKFAEGVSRSGSQIT